MQNGIVYEMNQRSRLYITAGWWIAKSFQAESTAELVVRLIGLAMVVLAMIWGYRLWSSHQKSGEETPRARASWFKYFRRKIKQGRKLD